MVRPTGSCSEAPFTQPVQDKTVVPLSHLAVPYEGYKGVLEGGGALSRQQRCNGAELTSVLKD